MGLTLEHVLSDIDQHRPGTTGRRNVKGFVQCLRKVSEVLHQKIVFRCRARDAERVGFLKRVAADQLARHLSR